MNRLTERIQVGDLVQVVRARTCCNGGTPNLGHVFRVNSIGRRRTSTCPYCGGGIPEIMVLADFHMAGYAMDRLKRIPPLSELEGVKTDEPIQEPA